MANELLINTLAIVVAIFLIYSGTISMANAQIIKETADNFLKMGWKDAQIYFGDEAELPTWEVGDSWVFDVDYNATFEEIITFSLSMENLYFEVTDKYDSLYKVDFCDELNGELTIEKPIKVSGKLYETTLEGYMLITQAELGIKRVNASIQGSVIVPLAPKIPFESNVELIFSTVYDHLDFPISVGEKWKIPANEISMNLWYKVADEEKSFNFDLPLWEDIAECTEVENINIEAGTFEAFHISSTIGTSEYYYAPVIGNIIKMFETDEEFDSVWELKSTTFDGPDKPDKPNGPTSGKMGTEYTYMSCTTDPEGDQIYYLFNWGDGTDSSWLGPYSSGQPASATHRWTSQSSYSIKVKAKDTNGAESHWSDPLSVSMPRNKAVKPLFIEPLTNIVENHPYLFPIIRFLQRQ